MAGKSDYLEGKALDHILTATSYTSPNATLYLSMHTGDPLDDNSGANEIDTVVDDTAYARQSIAFAAAAGGVSASNTAQTYSAVVYGTGAAPYIVTHVGIYDASTVGNLLYSQALTPARTLSVGEIASFDSGATTVTED